MNTATNEVLGHVTCPHCGSNNATVHKEKKGGAFYYRCYDGPHGPCGTVQVRGSGGQKYIKDNAVMIADENAQALREELGDRPEPVEANEQPTKRGWLDTFFGDDE